MTLATAKPLLGGETLGWRVALGRTGGNGNHQWLTARLISGIVTESGRLTGLLRQAACLGNGGQRFSFQPMDDGRFDFWNTARNIGRRCCGRPLFSQCDAFDKGLVSYYQIDRMRPNEAEDQPLAPPVLCHLPYFIRRQASGRG